MTTVVVRESEAKLGKTIGDQELALLQYIAGRGGVTVGLAAEEFGIPRGLARSTILTMMERLRNKGRLDRRRVAGVFRYVSREPVSALLKGVVRAFVEGTLGGSVSPFVAYLNDQTLTAEELRELEGVVSKLKASRLKEPHD